MFVSRGVGTVYVPVRINCPPEVAVLTLRQGTDARTENLDERDVCRQPLARLRRVSGTPPFKHHCRREQDRRSG